MLQSIKIITIPYLKNVILRNSKNKARLLSIIEEISKQPNSNLGIVDEEHENTALLDCLHYKMYDIAKMLIQTGQSNPGAKNEDGYTALIWAIKNNQENEIIEMFAVQVKEKYGTLRFYMSYYQ